MSIKKLFAGLLFSVLSFTQVVNAQDSDVERLLKISDAKKRIDTLDSYARSKVFIKAEEGLTASLYLTQEAIKQNDKKRLFTSFNIRGLALHYLQRGPEAEKILDTLITLAMKSKDTVMEGKGRGNMGMVLEKKGDFQNAFAQYVLALKLAEMSGNKSMIASSSGNLGNVLIRLQSYQKAIPFLKNASQVFSELGNINAEANQYNSLAQAYSDLEMNDTSYWYLQKAEAIYRKIGNNKALATVLTNLATYHKEHNNTKEAIKLGEEAVRIKMELQDYAGAAVAMLNLSEAYNKEEKFDKSLSLIRGADTLIEEADYFMKGEICRKSASLYRAKGDYKTAYGFILDYLDIKDSIIGEKAQQAVAEYREKFESEKKEFEIEKLKRSAEIDTLKIGQHRSQIYFMLGGLSLVILFAGFMYNRFKVTQKQKGIIEQQKEIVEEQKKIVEEKQKEVLDSIHYARRIQMAQIPNEKRVYSILKRIKGSNT